MKSSNTFCFLPSMPAWCQASPYSRAAAQVGHRVDAALLDERRHQRREARRQADVEAAVAVQQRRVACRRAPAPCGAPGTSAPACRPSTGSAPGATSKPVGVDGRRPASARPRSSPVAALAQVVPEDLRGRQVRGEAVEQLAARRAAPTARRRSPARAASISPASLPPASNRRTRDEASFRYSAAISFAAHHRDALQRLLALGDDLLPGVARRACVSVDREHPVAGRALVADARRCDRPAPRPAGTAPACRLTIGDRRRRPLSCVWCRAGRPRSWPSPATPRWPASARRATASPTASPSGRGPSPKIFGSWAGSLPSRWKIDVAVVLLLARRHRARQRVARVVEALAVGPPGHARRRACG